MIAAWCFECMKLDSLERNSRARLFLSRLSSFLECKVTTFDHIFDILTNSFSHFPNILKESSVLKLDSVFTLTVISAVLLALTGGVAQW